jgi:tetratricopeptide (TPR) repeat protein
MRGGTILYFALASIGLCACTQGASKSAAQVTPAQACLRALDPAVGIDACKTAIAADQNNAALRRQMGLLRLKSHALAAARQSYQVAINLNPTYDADAQFGLGLALEAIGEPGANLRKLEAVKHDAAVVDRFRKDGITEPDLMTFDTAPQIVGGASPAADKLLIPKQPLRQGLTVDVRCLVALTKRVHDCVVTTPLTPDQAVFGEAAKKIVAATRVAPARDKGAPVADAPIVMTYVFWPQG